FHVEAGALKHDAGDESPDLGKEFSAAALALAEQIESGADWQAAGAPHDLVGLLARDVAASNRKILAAFHDGVGGYPAQELGALAASWFPRLPHGGRLEAARALFAAVGAKREKEQDQELPRLRFHWMAKN